MNILWYKGLILIRDVYQTASIQQSLFWYHTINKKVVSLWIHGISKVHYISVNKSNYQWENARLMKQISIINNITPLAPGDIIHW